MYLQAETTYRDSSGFKKPLFPRENATRANKVRALETGWWRHQGSNLGPNHAVIEPVSAVRREREFPGQRRAPEKAAHRWQRPNQRHEESPKNPILAL